MFKTRRKASIAVSATLKCIHPDSLDTYLVIAYPPLPASLPLTASPPHSLPPPLKSFILPPPHPNGIRMHLRDVFSGSATVSLDAEVDVFLRTRRQLARLKTLSSTGCDTYYSRKTCSSALPFLLDTCVRMAAFLWLVCLGAGVNTSARHRRILTPRKECFTMLREVLYELHATTHLHIS
jgi:hypothetical protein